jgi:hypothetical protein
MANRYRPGIYSLSRVLRRTQTRKTALARGVQIKSQITKRHLCAWLYNRLRLKQMTGRRRLCTARIPAIVTIQRPISEKLMTNIAIFMQNINLYA